MYTRCAARSDRVNDERAHRECAEYMAYIVRVYAKAERLLHVHVEFARSSDRGVRKSADVSDCS